MVAEVQIHTERIDDVPLPVHQQGKMDIPEVVDGVIHPHGNRQGLSVGWLTTGWLSFILSEADHRMSEVEPWAEEKVMTHPESLHPANAEELATIAQEIGAEVLRGALRYPSESGGWQLGDLDLSEYLDKYRD